MLQRYPIARAFVKGWKVDMHFLLYAFVALCLSVAWDQVRYSTSSALRRHLLRSGCL